MDHAALTSGPNESAWRGQLAWFEYDVASQLSSHFSHLATIFPLTGMVFLVKAGMLTGWFYVQAAALFLTAILMALLPDYGHMIFGLVSAACFFFPGLKYYRQRRASAAR